jgi:hypothetical protein
MENNIDDNKAAGFVWNTICVLITLYTWRSYNTLPGDFLLGAFAVWALRNGMAYYKKAEKIENE